MLRVPQLIAWAYLLNMTNFGWRVEFFNYTIFPPNGVGMSGARPTAWVTYNVRSTLAHWTLVVCSLRVPP
jgi:hypothetical protein